MSTAAKQFTAEQLSVIVDDPVNRSIRVYRSRSTIEVLYEGDQLDAGDAMPGWILPVAEVFPP